MNDRYAELAARALVHADTKPSVRELGDRNVIVAAMRDALVARSATLRRRSWALRAFVTVSAAAATVVGLRWAIHHDRWPALRWHLDRDAPAPIAIVAHPIGGGATMQETTEIAAGGSPAGAGPIAPGTPLAEGASLGSGARIVSSRDGRVDLAFSTGTRILVEEGAEFAVIEQTAMQLFRLDHGAMDADVAPLHPGERFILRTPDAEIEVHGTSFRVGVVQGNPRCGDGTHTRIRVHSGRVAVRTRASQETLGPGDTWPVGCDDAPESPRAGVPGVESDAMGPPESNPAMAAQATKPPAPTSTTRTEPRRAVLAEVNDRYAEAIAAKRAGRPRQALEILERLQSMYPSNPLAETIMVEEIRLLHTIDRTRAAKQAARYLERYPDGFARSEAERERASVP